MLHIFFFVGVHRKAQFQTDNFQIVIARHTNTHTTNVSKKWVFVLFYFNFIFFSLFLSLFNVEIRNTL